MQFSLRTLLVLSTVICLLLAIWALLGTLGVLVSVGAIGLACWAGGLRGRSRWRVLVGAAVFVLVAIVLVFDMAATVYWIGSRVGMLDVQVVDATTGQPITNAAVGVSDGELSPDTLHPVDNDGRVQFAHEFSIAGPDSGLRITHSSSDSCPLHQCLNLVAEEANGEVHRYQLAALIGQESWPIEKKPLPPIVLKVSRPPSGRD